LLRQKDRKIISEQNKIINSKFKIFLTVKIQTIKFIPLILFFLPRSSFFKIQELFNIHK